MARLLAVLVAAGVLALGVLLGVAAPSSAHHDAGRSGPCVHVSDCHGMAPGSTYYDA